MRTVRQAAVMTLAVAVLLFVLPLGAQPASAGHRIDHVLASLLAGETLSTGTEPTATDTVVSSVTVPLAGTVEITEGSITQAAPSGWDFFGQQIDISAPLALAITDPLKLRFRIDATALPTSATASTVRMFRSGVELPNCSGEPGAASPDPCISTISLLSGGELEGDLEIVALTTAASPWNAGKPKGTDGTGSMSSSPASVTAASTGNTVTLTWTTPPEGMNGQAEITVPSGWSAPQKTDAAGLGYVSLTNIGCVGSQTKIASVAGMVITVDMQCNNASDQFSVTYGNATAPTAADDYFFNTRTRISNGTFTAIATQPKVAVGPGPLAGFAISSISTRTAGAEFTATVTAQDAYGNAITTYSGTPSLTHNLSDSTAGCGTEGTSPCTPAATLGTFSSGSATLTATAYKAETERRFTVSADTVASDSNSFAVDPAATDRLVVVAPAAATAGDAFDVTVTAKDRYDNTQTGHSGTVSFSSTDPQATLPAASALTAGTKTFSATLKTAGSRTITATDELVTTTTGTSGEISVAPAGLDHFSLAAPASATAGTAFSVTVTSQDLYGNTVTGYAGTIRFGSSDSRALLPADYAFTAADGGVRSFADGVILETAPSQTVTVADTAAPTKTGTATVAVNDGVAPVVTISGVSSTLLKEGETTSVTWFADEPGSYSVRVGGDGCTTGMVVASGSYSSGNETSTVTAVDLSEGPNTIRICVKDAGDNSGMDATSVTKDTVAPDTTITLGPTGTINTDWAVFYFHSTDPDAALECRLDGSGAFSPCSSGSKSYDLSSLPAGAYTFEVTATDPAGNTVPTPAGRSFTIDRGMPRAERLVGDVPAGATVSTGTRPSQVDPVITALTSPVAASLTIEETVVTQADPDEWAFFGQQVDISIPSAPSPDDPIRLVFGVAASAIPSGWRAADVMVFKDGRAVAPCIDGSGRADPDPCTSTLVEGDTVEITVLTVGASSWNFGVPRPQPAHGPPATPPGPPATPPGPPATPPTHIDATPPEVEWSLHPSHISPNGDGRKDAAELSAAFSERTTWSFSLQPQGEDAVLVSSTGEGMAMHLAWDGVVAGTQVPEGTYVWMLAGKDDFGNEMTPVTGIIIVDHTAPAVVSLRASPNPWKLVKHAAMRIRFSVTETATVRVKIVKRRQIVKRFRPVAVVGGQVVALKWRGRKGWARPVLPGRYRLVISAVDGAANRTVDRGTRIKVL